MGDLVAFRNTGGTWVEVAAVAAEQIAAHLAALPFAEVRGAVLAPIATDLTIEALEVEGCPSADLERARPIVRKRVLDFFFGAGEGAGA